ncbi:hypothetical protein HAZT_HAZT001522 [Hyalella azteca]|uniref:BHLH domain-containing protein n=1 Tax=Hyalella azteca TaxID=294128 RepID=A0A6A0H1Z2_HYAAZ|nr:hypothetical protein HAZT_HAZT001522 [Hyalella azteca]
MCRVLQLPTESLLEAPQPTVQHTLQHSSSAGVTNGLPALLTASDASETKLLLATDESSASPGTIFSSGGQLYLVGDAAPTIITGLPSASSVSVSSGGSLSVVNHSVNATSSSINNTNGSSNGCSLLLPRPPTTKNEGSASAVSSLLNSRGRAREDKRRVVHNEVERRRRDKINNWIGKLAKILPNCNEAHLRNVNMMTVILQSKAGILAKACDYIQEIQRENETLTETVRKQQRQQHELQLLREQNNQLKNENALLREQLS